MPALGPNVVDVIFEDLQRQILSDALRAGQRLPPERALSEHYRAHRHTVREAIIRLEQQGLVVVHQGRGATVTDFRRAANLSIIAPFLEHADDLGERVQAMADLLPARVEVLCLAVGLASARATPVDHAALGLATIQAVAAFRTGEREAVAAGYHAWLEALVEAAHALPVRWIANVLLDVNAKVMARFPELWVLEDSFPAHMSEVTTALVRGDGAAAQASMRAYFERVDGSLHELVGPILAAVAEPQE